jgi:hypothetical protein
MDPALVEQTANTVSTYMGATKLPAVDTMFTNKFVGSTRLTGQEWAEVEDRSSKVLPIRDEPKK